MGRYPLGALALALATLAGSRSAHAHGPPVVLGVSATDEQGASLVTLPEGMALRVGQSWSYLCPALWGDDDSVNGGAAKSASLDGGKTLLVGGDGLYAFDGHSFTATAGAEYGDAKIVAMTSGPGGVYALRFSAMGSQLVVLSDGGTSLWNSSQSWSALAAGDAEIYLARPFTDTALEIVTLSPQGDEFGTMVYETQTEIGQLGLTAIAGGLFVTIGNDGSRLLAKVDRGNWVPLAAAQESLVGPTTSPNGKLYVALDGRLQVLDPSSYVDATVSTAIPFSGCTDLTQRDPSSCVACLGLRQGLAYACVGPELFALTDSGIGPRIYDLHGLVGPNPGLVPEAERARCELQWSLIRADLNQNNLAPTEWAAQAEPSIPATPASTTAAPPSIAQADPPPRRTPSAPQAGCQVGGLGASGHLAWLALGWLAQRRRSRWRRDSDSFSG